MFVQGLRDTMGFNLAALNHLQRRLKSRHASMGDEGQIVPVKQPAVADAGAKGSRLH